jgi:photosystem II stability/assembly factor-like uncharacterized protein
MKPTFYLLLCAITTFTFTACDSEQEELVVPTLELLPCEEISENWEVTTSRSDPAYYPSDFLYVDENTAIGIRADAEIRRTTDGGTTWSYINRFFLPDGSGDSTALTSAQLRNISQDDNGVLYIIGSTEELEGYPSIDPEEAKGVVLRSSDMGLTWSKSYFGADLLWVDTGIFFGNGRGFLGGRAVSSQVGDRNEFFETYDGGESWTPILPDFSLKGYNDDFHTSPNGNIYRITSNNGEYTRLLFNMASEEWEPANVPGPYLFYVTENIIFCRDVHRKIHKSTDGGLTWEEDHEIVLNEYDKLNFYSAGEDNWMVIVSRREFVSITGDVAPVTTVKVNHFDIHETTDGGESWTLRQISPDCLMNVEDRYFENIGHVLIFCNEKQIIRFNP